MSWSPNLGSGKISPRTRQKFVLALIVLLGAILRLYDLESMPAGLSGDEGADGLGAKRILSGEELPLFITEDFGEEPMHTYLVALSFWLWGPRLWAIRVVSAFVGIATIPLIYWLSRELLQQHGRSCSLVPMLSAFFLATSYWHVIYSRAGLEVATLPLFSSALAYFLWRGIRTGRRWTFIVSGLILGASLYSYRGARFLPILHALFFGGWAIASREFRRRHLTNLLLAALTAVLVCAPLGVYAIAHPDVFFAREMHVSIFNPDWGRGPPVQALGYSVAKTLGMFNFGGDPEFARNPGGRPVLDPISSLCFFAGLAVAMSRWRRPRWLFVLSWFFIMALPGAFAAEVLPHFHRGIGALPPLCLLVGVGAAWIKERVQKVIPWERASVASWALLGVILATSTALTYRDYFHPWQQRLHQGEIIGGSLIKAAEVMNGTRIPGGVWILPASSLRPRNLPYYEVSFLYDGPEPEYTLNVDEGTAPAELSQITKGHERVAVINWKEYVLEEAYLSLNSDPKGLLDFLFKKYGRHISTDAHQSFDLVLYEIPPSTDFSIAHRLEAVSVDFGGALRLEGVALGGSSVHDTSTEQDVESETLPSGKEGWVVLQWRALGGLDANYKVAVYLLDGQGRVAGQTDKLLLSNHLEPTSNWDPQQLEIDYYTLPSQPATPPGRYAAQVAVYDANTLERLPIFDAQTGASTTSVAIGELEVAKPLTPPEIRPLEELPSSQGSVAPGLQLLGYDAPVRAASPGETVRVALYWRATEDLTEDYLLSVGLRSEEQTIWLEQNQHPVNGTYPTNEWEAGEVLRDWHDLRLPPDTPPGTHEVLLRVLEGGETLGQVSLGSIELSGRPRRFDIPEIQHPVDARLGDAVLFLGYDLSSEEAKPGDTLHLTLYWQALEEMQVSYT
ncbi:MAG TPA: hypothetical protein ENO24_10090, partial [Chloroflexi bacterium]|nr:hypothetical protein [Chloroflexota bacterium]